MNQPPESRWERFWRRLINCSRIEHCFHTGMYEDDPDYCCECGKIHKEEDWGRRGFSRWWFYHF